MDSIDIGALVEISGTFLTGRVIARDEAGLLTVELDDEHDELPTDLCTWSKPGTVLWPAYAEELELQDAE